VARLEVKDMAKRQSKKVPIQTEDAALETPLYEARNVSKKYGSFIALEGMNFHIGKNEVVGLLGDNGAGKSTLVKMISGINPPTSGDVFING
jgi:simple sugar transport system ATP-binding protein